MTVPVVLYAVVATLVSLFFTVRIVRSLVVGRKCRRKELLSGKSLIYGSDPMCEIGVSLLCGGVVDLNYVERLLSLDYVRYEVVVTADGERDELFGALLKKYSMIRVNLPHIDYTLQASTRQLFRSRQRRYRRLVVVDSAASDLFQQLNCGLAVCSFDRVVPLENGCMPRPESLRTMVAELHENGTNAHYAVCGFCAPRGSAAMRALGLLANLARTSRDRVAMLDRDSVVDTGGFCRTRHLTADTLCRITEFYGSRTLIINDVLADGCQRVRYSVAPLAFGIAGVLLLILSSLYGGDVFETAVLAFAVLLCCGFAAGALCTLAEPEISFKERILTTFALPFWYMKSRLSVIKFLQNENYD